MTSPQDGIYRILFNDHQVLTSLDSRPQSGLCLLPSNGDGAQEWQVSRGPDGHTISLPDGSLFVSFDGDPDMHELALLLPQPRAWNLIPGTEPDTYIIGVPRTPMRLGMSLLRIFPPRVALAPEYGDPYQAWTLKNIG